MDMPAAGVGPTVAIMMIMMVIVIVIVILTETVGDHDDTDH